MQTTNPMQLSVIKILTLILFFVAVVPTQKVSAIDNDAIGNDCVITIGDVQTTSNYAPSVNVPEDAGDLPANPTNDSTEPEQWEDLDHNSDSSHNYEIKVCGNNFSVPLGETAVATLPQVGLLFKPLEYNVDIPLTQTGNCLVGNFSSSPRVFAIDIESNSTRTPMCKREYGKLIPMSQEHLTSFLEEQKNFCSHILVNPKDPIVNRQVLISALYPEVFKSQSGRFVGPNPLRRYQLMFSLQYENGNEIDRITALDVGKTYFEKFFYPTVQTNYVASFWLQDNRNKILDLCSVSFSVGTTENPGNSNIGLNIIGKNKFDLCSQIPKSEENAISSCNTCINSESGGIWTALGCIPTDGAGTVRTFISIALGMAGGIGLLMIIAAGAMFALSQNDPTKVNSARDLLTSVIIGLLFIVFSVTILQFIGVTILQIPGFGT